MSEKFFTAEEVAERLRLNKVTVHRWIRSGRLPAVNLKGTSGYRVRGSDVEAYLWTEYGGMAGQFRRAARALYEAASAAEEYAARFDNPPMGERSAELRAQADRLLLEAEHFHDVQGFYRPARQPATLRELQPFMAAPHVYDAGNPDFQVVAVMVRDAIGDGPPPPMQSVKGWIAKAETTNPPETEHGRLIRIAGPLLLARYNSDG